MERESEGGEVWGGVVGYGDGGDDVVWNEGGGGEVNEGVCFWD